MRAMNVDLGIWDRVSRLIVLLLVIAAGVGVIYSYVPGARDNERKRLELHQRQSDIRAELQRSNDLRGKIQAMLWDDRALERKGREVMNLARTNEVVIRLVEPATNGAAGSRR